MTTLKQAREQGKLEEFIAEREAEQTKRGDAKAFNRAVEAMAGKSKAAPKASTKDCADD